VCRKAPAVQNSTLCKLTSHNRPTLFAKPRDTTLFAMPRDTTLFVMPRDTTFHVESLVITFCMHEGAFVPPEGWVGSFLVSQCVGPWQWGGTDGCTNADSDSVAAAAGRLS
jgi:hypothetical protein